MAARTSMLHIRVDDALKAKATETLAAIDLSMEDADTPPGAEWKGRPPRK